MECQEKLKPTSVCLSNPRASSHAQNETQQRLARFAINGWNPDSSALNWPKTSQCVGCGASVPDWMMYCANCRPQPQPKDK